MQQIDQLRSRRASFQRKANHLHNKIQQLELEICDTRQQAATAEEMAQTADKEYQCLDQPLEQMLNSANAMLTVMQKVKRRRLSDSRALETSLHIAVAS